MRVLAARIGSDLTGYVWIVDDGGDLLKRHWYSGTVPAYPAVVKRSESLLDLIARGVDLAMRQYRFPPYLRDEMLSEAGLQVARALRNADGDDNRRLLITVAVRGAVDAVRREWGRARDREQPSEDLKNVRRPAYLEEAAPDPDGRGWEETLDDRNQQAPGDTLAQVDLIKAILARLPNDRHREVALRTAYGQTELEVGKMMGVSESRISQILGKIRKTLDETEGMDRWELEAIPPETGASNSLTASWR